MKHFVKFLIIFIFCQSHTIWSLSPSSDYFQYPFGVFNDIQVDSLTVQTEDTTNIHIWHFHSTKKTLHTNLYFLHPGEGNMSNYIARAALWAQQGFTVILFDYRGFGRSDAYHIEEDQLYIDEFSIDFKAVYNKMQQLLPHHKSAVYALGMGTIISQLFLLDNQKKIEFAIYEGFVHNPIQYIAKLNAPGARKTTLPASAYNYEKLTRKISTRTLIFVGMEDELAPLQDVKKYSSLKPKSRFIELYDGPHLQATYIMSEHEYGDIYMKKCLDFIRKINK